MRIHSFIRRLGLLLAAAALPALAGCDAGHAKYTPNQDEARQALETALKAWASGRPAGEIDATPAVRVVDSAWREGQRLEAFQVVGEEDADGGAKRFTVRLTLLPPAARKGARDSAAAKDREVVYLVHGRDPFWVYSADDYRRVLDMDNNPSTSKPAPRRGGRRG